ncbi:sushi, von Willebrand factor type A, EGF and pentraxin domain-containing protein 1-like [Ptychodera flava]|uniref:sushi, von Willebrand factor type A, EGF and pentraxin domain-containing protein 1-like n=1 Tax=Ptychodera flava TaxID=63121 RepID=UPI00396A0935
MDTFIIVTIIKTIFIASVPFIINTADGADCQGDGAFTMKKVMLDSSCEWSYVAISQPVPTMSAFTLCVWMKSSDTPGNGTLFSYATATTVEEIDLRSENGDLTFVIKSQAVITSNLDIYDGMWHHVCVKWESTDGQWSVFQNGQTVSSGTLLSANTEVDGGGIAIIGQGQAIVGGGFSRTRSFTGDVANFNLWSQALSGLDLQDISINCFGDVNCGDVISWSSFTPTDLTNSVLLPSDTCGSSIFSCRESIALKKGYQGGFQGSIITSFNGSSTMMDCARRCAKMSTCRSIDYSKEQQVCQLSRGSVGNTPDMVYFEDSARYEVVNSVAEASNDACASQPCSAGEVCQATSCGKYECVIPPPTCADCDSPEQLQNGYHSGEYYHSHMVTFSCNPGHTLTGPTVLMCDNGVWNDSYPVCHADCTDPGTPLNGQQSGSYQHGDTLTFSCNVGYTLDGADSTLCGDGSWSNASPLCRSDCTDPGTPLNGQQSGGNKHGDAVTFSCNVGYTLDGADSTLCGDGSWSNASPLCRSFCDCAEVKGFGFTTNGIYYIKPAGIVSPVEVFCDMATDGGGWTVIQNHVNNSVDFARDWQGYKDGFGVLGWGYWFGNDNIHYLTTQDTYILRIEVSDYSGNDIWANFNAFSIADETSLYTMTIGSQLDGNEADQMTYHNGVPFSTRDNDNENNPDYNCGDFLESGWWYKQEFLPGHNVACYMSDFNKPFVPNCPNPLGPKYGVGVDGVEYCLRTTSMKVRPSLPMR